MAEKSKKTAQKNSQKKGGKTAAGIILVPLIFAAVAAGVYFAGKGLWTKDKPETSQTLDDAAETAETAETTVTTAETTETTVRFPAAPTTATETIDINDPTKVLARNCVLLEVDGNESKILASHEADTEIYPASMTKMMTLITFVDMVDPDVLEDTIIMDPAVVAEQEAQMAYVAGFTPGEACRVKDLLYAMMLPSGADAAMVLANYVSGSEAAFAEEMNRMAAEMGLEHSHFVNCTGLHNDAHTSSINDMARILQFAMNDPVCNEIMSTLQYTTATTLEHPEGIKLTSTTLSRMVGNELEGLADPLHIRGGKTGFTNPAGQCLAVWAESDSGKTYICVVAGSTTFEPLDAVGDVLTLCQLTSIPWENIQRITVSEENLPLYEHY